MPGGSGGARYSVYNEPLGQFGAAFDPYEVIIRGQMDEPVPGLDYRTAQKNRQDLIESTLKDVDYARKQAGDEAWLLPQFQDMSENQLREWSLRNLPSRLPASLKGGRGPGGPAGGSGPRSRGSLDGPATDFERAKGPVGPPPRRDPLILDLDGDGIQTISIEAGTCFDYDCNGFAEQTGWVDPHDGLLALDKNGDGVINDGTELFDSHTLLKGGTRATNGFQALAELDSNHDGKIDAADPAFSQLRVWRDSYGDGYSVPSELTTLDQLGIKSVNLDWTITNSTDVPGNIQDSVGSFEWTDGTAGQIGQYSLQTDATYSIPTEWFNLPEDIAALPGLRGYGTVHNLLQVVTRDTSGELKSLVENFVNTTDPTLLDSLMEQILFKWTGVEGIDPNSRGPNINARKLAVLEKFFGQSFVGTNGPNPTYAASILLNESYHKLFEIIEGRYMSETHLKGLYDEITYTYDSENQQVIADFNAVITDIQTQLANNPDHGKQLLGQFARSLRGIGFLSQNDYLSFRETFIEQDPNLARVFDTGGLPVYDQLGQSPDGWYYPHMFGTWGSDAVKGSATQGDGYINGLSGNDVIYGTDRNEYLFNQDGNSLIVAGGGTDYIWAGVGNDILDGGTGTDLLYGEAGNDTYIFRRGSGRDTLIETDPAPGNVDTIWMGSSLSPDDIAVKRAGNDLVLKIIGTNDTMTVQSWFDARSVSFEQVEQVQFADGTTWDVNEIIRRQSQPTEGDDYLAGGTGDDLINALGGNDIVLGLGGNDTLTGGSGDDRLYGGPGADVLEGGPGYDQLDGGPGNDTYVFARGYGRDAITDSETTHGNVDSVFFSDILPSEVTVGRNLDDLTISVGNSGDTVTVKDVFGGRDGRDFHCPIEVFEFADGTQWEGSTIQNIFLAGTEGPDWIYGFNSADTIQGFGGSDHVFALAGDDLVMGGDGNDTLIGGLGNDTLDGGPGSDMLNGGDGYYLYSVWHGTSGANGNDTYLFGRGSGQDIVLDDDKTPGNLDTIRLADDITPADVTVQRREDNLQLSIGGADDTLTVRKWFQDDAGEFQVEQIQFADGTIWNVETIKQKALQGTSGNDTLIGYSTADLIQGYDANDMLYGRGGDDTLEGGGRE